MSRGRIVAVVAGGCAAALLVVGVGVGATALMLFGGGSTALTGGDCGYDVPAGGPAILPATGAVPGSPSPTPSATASAPARIEPIGQWATEQVGNAAVVVAVGRELGVPPRGWVVAVATAMQESGLRNLPGGDRDSIGLLQQRPSMGWGTPEQLGSPEYQARQFYARLLRIDGWTSMRLTDAAQSVQRSATPEAYQRWETEAEAVVAGVLGVASVDLLGGGFPAAPCGVAALSAAVVPAGTWTTPVPAAIGSGFRTPARPGHDGVDFVAARYTPVHAASSGTVLTVLCNASTGDCDRDGGMSVRGCGWYVEILHADDVVTRYCHLVRRPEVSVGDTVAGGQVLGFVGSSGNSSGPHLHFEVHLGTTATSANAVDPVPFLARMGVPLGA
ncbi:MAG TPA: M23 family metallopeptidase [Mycobacteriales bacterium]|nr:M23 family metallopeptidase [Mycobacteriales bacterium]